MTVSPLTHELRLAEMVRALRWLPDVWLEATHYRTTSYRLFTLLPFAFCAAHDAAALRIEKTRRLAFGEANVLGEVA